MPGLEVRGLGGGGMHALCPEVEDWADEAAVIGFVEVAKKYGWFRNASWRCWSRSAVTSRIAWS